MRGKKRNGREGVDGGRAGGGKEPQVGRRGAAVNEGDTWGGGGREQEARPNIKWVVRRMTRQTRAVRERRGEAKRGGGEKKERRKRKGKKKTELQNKSQVSSEKMKMYREGKEEEEAYAEGGVGKWIKKRK